MFCVEIYCPLSGTDFQRDKRWRRFWNWPSIDRPNEALRPLISFSIAPSQLKSLQLHSWGLPCFHWLPESLATSLQLRSSSNIWKVITWRSSTDLFTFTSCLYQSNSSLPIFHPLIEEIVQELINDCLPVMSLWRVDFACSCYKSFADFTPQK